MIDLTLDSLTVPGIPDYTPPFGTQKDPLVSLSTVETQNNIIKPFTAQRAIEFSHDETLSRIERNAVLVYTGDADAVLDMSSVTAFKGNEIKIVNSTSHALTVKYLEVGEKSYSTMNLTENSTTLIADSNTTYSVKAIVESESITTLWTGTKEQFDAIPIKDSNTLYNIIDDVDEELIQDDKISPNSTWSSERIARSFPPYNIFTKEGAYLGANPGLLQRKRAKTLFILGNSFTSCSAWEGYEVSDGRGMGATTPQKDYKHRVRAFLRENYDPNFEVYFMAVGWWETQTIGQRNINSGSHPVYKVTDKGHELWGDFADFKTEFSSVVDAVFIQAYENMPVPSTDLDLKNTVIDLLQLTVDLRNAFTEAELYNWFGMWYAYGRSLCVGQSLSMTREHPVFCPAFSPINDSDGNWDAYKIPVGDKIYDAEGNLIYTIPTNCPQDVLNHPNDLGHGIIASTLLYSLFNDQTDNAYLFHCEEEEFWKGKTPYFRRTLIGTATSQSTDPDFANMIKTRLAYITFPGKFACYGYMPQGSSEYWQGDICFRNHVSGLEIEHNQISQSLKDYVNIVLENEFTVTGATASAAHYFKETYLSIGAATNIAYVKATV